MSLIKKIFPLMILGLIIGFILSIFFPSLNKSIVRNPTNILGKPNTMFRIDIKPKQKILPVDKESEVTFIAKVYFNTPMNGEIHYNWILPLETELVDYERNDSIEINDNMSFVEIPITIQGINSESFEKIITLQVYTEIGDVQLGNAGVFSVSDYVKSLNLISTKGTTFNQLPKGIQQ